MTPREKSLIEKVGKAVEENPIEMGRYIMEVLVNNRLRSYHTEVVERDPLIYDILASGLVLGSYHDGRSGAILAAAHEALEDANHHEQAEKLREAFPRIFANLTRHV